MNICPLCHFNNEDGMVSCKSCKKRMYTEPQTEWGSYIRQFAQGYRSGKAKGLAHGIQKDAIQNSWGARKKDKGWKCEFDLVKDPKGITYLTITDQGTFGLTGKVYDEPDDIPNDLSPDERLSRFENMNFSGSNYGPGLYGRGKLIFQAASKQESIIYDSLLGNGEYRLGRRFREGRHLKQFQRVLIGEDAKKMLGSLANNCIQPLTNTGTRIIIVDPIDEIVESIESEEFLEYINETWWEILQKTDAKIVVSNDGKMKEASCPNLIEKLAKRKFPEKQMHYHNDDTVSIKGSSYRIKKIYMAKADSSVSESLRGLYIQRKGMKIGCVDLSDFPPDLEELFFGFIQLEKDYEQKIEEAEDLEHYSFSATYSSYRELKKYAQLQFDEFKEKLGYDVSTDKSVDEKAQDSLKVADEKLNQVMEDLGLSGLGKSSKRKEITITVENVSFPCQSNRVEAGDEIKDILFTVRNKSNRGLDVKIIVSTVSLRGILLEEISSRQMKIGSGQEGQVGPLSVKIAPSVYPDQEQIFCICKAEEKGDTKAVARIPIFIGIDAPQAEEPVLLQLTDIDFPEEKSARVDYDQEIKNLRYLIVSQSAEDLSIHFSVKATDPQNDDLLIEKIIEQDFVLKSYSEKEVEIPKIFIDKSVYSIVSEGPVTIRSVVASSISQFNYKKGKKLAKHAIRFWLNQDEPGFGIFEGRETFHGGPDTPRSKVQQGSNTDRWVFMLNVTHPHYEAVRDKTDLRNAYIFELMAREALYLALHSERYEAFSGKIGQDNLPYEISRAYNATLDKILASYY